MHGGCVRGRGGASKKNGSKALLCHSYLLISPQAGSEQVVSITLGLLGVVPLEFKRVALIVYLSVFSIALQRL